MANEVPILRVDIDDSEFRTFQERIKQFRDEEAQAPEAWAGVTAQVETLRKRFEEMTESLVDQERASDKTADNAGRAASTIGGLSDAWRLMRPHVRGFGGTVASATRDLAKWERLTATFSALLGAGGLYGLDVLAASAANRRRRASSAGVSTGELAAFQTNFKQFGATDSLLEGFNRAAVDRTQQQPLQSLGVDPRGKNALQLFNEALPRVKALVDRTDPRLLGPTLGAYNLDKLGFDENMLRLIRRMSRQEVDDMLRGARTDAQRFEIPDDIGRKWQELETQLTRAGNQLQTALADDLVNITPGLTKVSESAVRLVDTLMSRPELVTWLNDAGKGVEALATRIGSQEAVDEMKKAVERFKMSRDDFAKLESWLDGHAWLAKDFAIIYAGYKAFSLGSKIGGAARLAAMAAGELNPALAAGALSLYMAKHRFGTFAPENFTDTPENRHKTQNLTEVPENGTEDDNPQAGNPYAPQSNKKAAPAPEPNTKAVTSSYEVKPSDGKPVPPLALNHLFGRQPDVKDVDPRLTEVVAAAQTKLPPGYRVEVMEGYNPNGHVANSQHHIKGQGALDIQIFGPDGKAISNRGDEAIDGPYHRLARAAYGEMLSRHPELKGRLAWGGAFGTVTGGSTSDLMHYDLGGERGHLVQNQLSRMGPLPEQLADRAKAAPSSGLVGLRKADPTGGASLMAAHPNNKPPPTPVVHVTDNTGGASLVATHH